MPIMLPNLDDRRWADLVEEGRALIPVYAPEWTDHNAHDPGITLMELLAWVAEMNIFQLNQIPDSHRRKFLALLGIVRRPPSPARTVLNLTLKTGSQSLRLPESLEFSGTDAAGVERSFRTLHAIDAVAGSVTAVQSQDGTGYRDLSTSLRRGQAMAIFGSSPSVGAEFYLGFSDALPVGIAVHLHFTFSGGNSAWKDRERLLTESREQAQSCAAPANPCAGSDSGTYESNHNPAVPAHHSVRTVWEFLGDAGGTATWLPLSASDKQVDDSTRALTLDGAVVLTMPSSMQQSAVGAVTQALFYVRCRITGGIYDAAPLLQTIAFNGIVIEQSVPVSTSLIIERSAKIVYAPTGPPRAGEGTGVLFTQNTQGHIASLTFDVAGEDTPKFFVQKYLAPTANDAGLLVFEAALLGTGTGYPEQMFFLPETIAHPSSTNLYSVLSGSYRKWTAVEDFDAATWADHAYRLDPSSGTVAFSDGRQTNLPAATSQCLVQYRRTDAEDGNVTAAFVKLLSDSPHNHALLSAPEGEEGSWTTVAARITAINNPSQAEGGASEESVEQAAARAVAMISTTDRAVTIDDYERLALTVPGTRVARAASFANLHPDFPCYQAPGMVTVVVVPYLPAGQPTPSAGLCRIVSRYLSRRRIIGTRVTVAAPTYIELNVSATVQSLARAERVAVRLRILAALSTFLDPLSGGPNGTGWPFGRDVYRTEIMQVIAGVSGVDYITSLTLRGATCDPQCGNLCLGPMALVLSGTHEIEVV